MKIWKVILATIVIFAAGAIAGGMLVRSVMPPRRSAEAPVPPILMQQRFQAKLKRELQLTAEQTNRVDRIFSESNARIKILWELVGPEMDKELQEVRQSIRGVLSPEQREKFEQLLKQSPRRPEGYRGRSGTNESSTPKAAR